MENSFPPNQHGDALDEFEGDENKTQIFMRVRKILSEELGMDEEDVDLKTTVFTTKIYNKRNWSNISSPHIEVPFYRIIPGEASRYEKLLSTELGDSVDATEILMALEEEFDIEIIESDAMALRIARDIVNYIDKKVLE